MGISVALGAYQRHPKKSCKKVYTAFVVASAEPPNKEMCSPLVVIRMLSGEATASGAIPTRIIFLLLSFSVAGRIGRATPVIALKYSCSNSAAVKAELVVVDSYAIS